MKRVYKPSGSKMTDPAGQEAAKIRNQETGIR
jgi:hypothetical protein